MSNTTSEMEALQPPATKNGADPSPSGYYNSYQNAPPVVTQLGDILPQRHAYYGDATLQPNTGLTNSYDYALFGLALNELLDRLRLSIIINAVLMFLITFLTWWTRLFRPFEMVLSILLGILVLILLVVEVQSIFKSAGTDSASSSATAEDENGSSNRAKLTKFLKFTEQIGLMILYHPIGKTIYLVTCGCLCSWISGVWEKLLGLMFVANAGVLFYCWVTYPEFRRTFESAEQGVDEEEGSMSEARSASWSYYCQTTLPEKVSEKASLLSSAFHKHETV